MPSEDNPYIIGRPIYEPEYFFGREDLFRFIQDNLNQKAKAILLYGQRRIGKSSILTQIPNFVKLDNFVFVPLSLEGKSHKPLDVVLYELSNEITEHLSEDLGFNEIEVSSNLKKEYANRGSRVFDHVFLPEVYKAIGNKNLVLLIDEFDVLGDCSEKSAVNHFFPYLNSILSSQEKLFIIPVMGRRLEEMPNLLGLFREAPNQEIGLLDRKSAERLIVNPSQGILDYTSEAIDEILNLSAGHPYFTQVICFAVFASARDEQKWRVTYSDVETAIDKSIEIGEGGLAWFRDGLPVPERIVFSATAESQSLSESKNNFIAPLALLESYGAEQTDGLRNAISNLVKWGFLQEVDLNHNEIALTSQSNFTYRVVINLVYYWLLKRHSLRQEILQLENSDLEANQIYDVAISRYKRGDALNAVSLYEQALVLNPNLFGALFNLADRYLDSGNFSKALELYLRAHKLDPLRTQKGLIRTSEEYGKQLIKQRQLDLAREQFERIISLQPDHESAKKKVKEIQNLERKLKQNKILDPVEFFKACNPSRVLEFSNDDAYKYYVNFSDVRGIDIVHEFSRVINLSVDEPTCQLLTGHIGSGKSTELSRLKSTLESKNFHVVYCDISSDVDMSDVDVNDIFLAIARRVSESLSNQKIRLKPKYFDNLFREINDLLQTPLELSFESELSPGIGRITARTKESPKLRRMIGQYLESRTGNLLQAINDELLEPATQQLKQRGIKGLVLIVDELDRLSTLLTSSGRTQQEYLFIDRGSQLKNLNAHLIYTVPLQLIFSNELLPLSSHFGARPRVLPLIPVRQRNDKINPVAIQSLREMILRRAFPDGNAELIGQVFDTSETLDTLCVISGGHLRNLLGILHSCLQRSDPPFSRALLENVLRDYRSDRVIAISHDEWSLLSNVALQKSLDSSDKREYQNLLRSLFVFEYQDENGYWFDVNPILKGAEEFQQHMNNLERW